MRPVDEEGAAIVLLAPLGVPVSTRVPNPRPTAHVRVTRAGGVQANLVQDRPTLLIECWAGSSIAAFDLAAWAWSLLEAEHRQSAEMSSPVNFPDPLTDLPRYQFQIQYYSNLTNEETP